MKLSRPVTAILSVALLTFMVSDALGQGRRGGGGFGGGGFGGFGGRGGGSSVSGTVFGLLRVDAVKEEIDLMPPQEEAIAKISEQSRGERPDFDFRNASEAERTEFFEKMRKQGEERAQKMAEQLEEVLDFEQMERVREIAIQQLGVRALTDKEIAGELELSADQTKKVAEAIEKSSSEMREKMMAMFRGGRGGDGGPGGRPPRGEGGGDSEGGTDPRAQMRETFAKMREEGEKTVLEILSTSQKSDFEEMKGEKFEMPEGAFGFGGRGGRGGGPGGPGGAGGRGGRGGGPGGAGGRGGGPGGRGGDGGGRRRPAADDDE